MNRRMSVIKKITNITGIVMIMLGTIPAPVFAQVSDLVAAEGVGATNVVIATSYSALLGETGDQPVEPTEEPAEAPVEVELSPTPSLEIFTDEDDLCPNDDSKLEPGLCGCGVPDVDSDGDGKKDCEDSCPLDETDACLPSLPSDLQPKDVEQVIEIIAEAADKDVTLTDAEGEPLEMAAQETADLLVEGDPLIVRGGINYYFLTDCSGVIAPDVCTATATPLTDAVAFALTGETIVIAAGTYNENVLVDKNIILIGGVGGVNVLSFTLSHPVNSLSSWTNINTDLVYIITDSNSQGSIQDGVDLVASGGEVKVGEGTYAGGITVDKPVEISGNVGNPTLPGPGKDAPEITQSDGNWQNGKGVDIQSTGVTVQGFVFKGFQYGVDVNALGGINLNNNIFLYTPADGEAIEGGPAGTEAYNIIFPDELNGKFYNNECGSAANCSKDESFNNTAGEETYCGLSANVVNIKTGSQNGYEFFFTKDTQDCDCATDLYCVSWDESDCITVKLCAGQDVSHVEFWEFELDEPSCGDGNLDAGEECDPLAAPGTAGYDAHCNASCTVDPFCGDGNLDAGETCDPWRPQWVTAVMMHTAMRVARLIHSAVTAIWTRARPAIPWPRQVHRDMMRIVKPIARSRGRLKFVMCQQEMAIRKPCWFGKANGTMVAWEPMARDRMVPDATVVIH